MKPVQSPCPPVEMALGDVLRDHRGAVDLAKCGSLSGQQKQLLYSSIERTVQSLGPFHAPRLKVNCSNRVPIPDWDLLYVSNSSVYVNVPTSSGMFVVTLTVLLGDHGKTSFPEKVPFRGLAQVLLPFRPQKQRCTNAVQGSV